MSLIDIGANLTHDSFQDDLDDVLNSASAQGVKKLIVTGASLAGSIDAVKLAQSNPETLSATAGIHPHHAEETNAEAIAQLRTLAAKPIVKAIGETGLDYFRDFSPRDQQRDSFIRHIELAIETGLPMFLHERDAADDFIMILKDYRAELCDVVVHCFTGNEAALDAYLDLDLHIGITGWICDERRGQHLIPLVTRIPDNRLMIETDSPYLMPRTLRPKPKSRRNEPKHLAHICDFIARCRNQSSSHIAAITTENAQRFFKLPK